MRTLLLATLLSASACTSPPMPVFGGAPSSPTSAFTEERLPDGRYRIAYVAPDPASAAIVADRVLVRAARLTLDKGNEWFEIASKVDGRLEGKPTQTVVIVMGKGETLAGGPRQYKAKDILASRSRVG